MINFTRKQKIILVCGYAIAVIVGMDWLETAASRRSFGELVAMWAMLGGGTWVAMILFHPRQ